MVDPRTATQAPDDPVCGTGSSIWYRYTPPARTRFLIGFGDGGEDASIGIYTGSRGALNRAGCWTFGHADLIVTGGRTYHVMLKGLPNIGYGWPIWFATEKLKKSLTLRVDKSRVVFGGKVRLRARLGSIADLNDFQLKFYSTTNGVKRLVARGYVNPQGDLIRYVRPQRTTSYTVEWAGEERYYPATSDWRRVEVAAKVVTTLERFYARSGADRLYRRGLDPRVLVKVRPNHAGQRISLFLEAQVGSTWHDVGLSRFRLGSKSAVRIRIVRPAAGYRYRVRAWFHGDDDHLPNDARPVYFRVVG